MTLWALLGRLVFWLTWPLLYVYLRSARRTRILVLSGNEALLTKGWLGSGKWVLPGGGLHAKEDPTEGVLRELREETGVRLDRAKVHHLGLVQARDTGLHFRYHQFAAELPDKPATKRGREVIQVRWVPLADLTETTAEQSTIDTLRAWKSRP